MRTRSTPVCYNVTEAASAGTNLSDYNVTGPVCVDTANGNAPVAVNGAGDLSVGFNQDIVCTITNTRKIGKIELAKDWVGTAGTSTSSSRRAA